MLRTIAVSLLVGSVLAGPQLDRRANPACPADDCSRAVFGTRVAGRSAAGVAACMSYQMTTASPCTTTTTVVTTTSVTDSTASVTLTVTSGTTTVNPPAQKAKRTLEARIAAPVCTSPAVITPSVVPVYATSACTGTRFASLCSCVGYSAVTTTLTTPTSIVTSTITSTFTATTVVGTTTVPATATAAVCTPGTFSSGSNSYNALCNTNLSGDKGNYIRYDTGISDVKACAAICDGVSNCRAVVYYRIDVGTAPNERAGNCFLLSYAENTPEYASTTPAADSAIRVQRDLDCTSEEVAVTGGSASITCGKNYAGGSNILSSSRGGVASTQACAQLCAETAGCNFADFYLRDFGPLEGPPYGQRQGQCYLLSNDANGSNMGAGVAAIAITRTSGT